MTNSASRMSLGTKLTYLVIVLLWLSAAGAVYFVFIAPGESKAREATPSVKPVTAHVDAEADFHLSPDFPKREIDKPEESELPRELPEFEFVNQSNEKVSRDSLKGKPWVATFVFTKCPGPCPMITGRMKVLQQDMKRYDLNLISITVDPERDTPEILTKYAEAFSADASNWHFLTGDRAEIYALIQEGFKMPVGEIKPGDILHTNRFVVVDAEGNYSDSFLAMNDEEFAKLKKRLREIAVRKSDVDTSDPSESKEESSGNSRDGE